MKSAMRWVHVFWKEVRENLRDRRTMVTTFLVSPLLGPVLMAGLIGLILTIEKSRSEKPLELPVINAQLAPNFVSFLSQHGVKVKKAPENPEQTVRERDADVVLRISPEFPEHWRSGESAVIELLHDPSRQAAMASFSRVTGLISAYSQQMGSQRLVLRGIDPELMRAVEIRRVDLSTAESRGSQVFSIMPYMLFLTIFMGGMYMAIDATAGERERQSLEPLLINPLSRGQIMTGKVAASGAFALASLALTLLIYLVGFKLVPLEQFGMKLGLTFGTILVLFVSMVPLAIAASAAQTALAAFSKSFREAQSQVSLLMLIPALPSMMLTLNPIKPKLWFYSVPFFGNNFIIERALRGEGFDWAMVGLNFVCSMLLAALLLWAATQMYKRESLAVST